MAEAETVTLHYREDPDAMEARVAAGGRKYDFDRPDPRVILADQIESIEDPNLRKALERQRVLNLGQSANTLLVVAFPDDTFSHASIVRREPLA